ncbi:hypothetical protein KUCAC02_008445 [Chaenocephalus aceratus]|uniref:Uncharacterized protein n=1 Tax=Chaenocephalus aceratus TaxID=36190 RepID=A0ACB9XAJ9_CHAAC|nr:hypothetical protein KUCAC02_008445 [Chaenocephalus aceratus]
MAHRFLSSTNRFSARFAFIFTVSLSLHIFMLQYSFLSQHSYDKPGLRGEKMPAEQERRREETSWKLDNCASLEVRSALDGSAAPRGYSDLRDIKTTASSGHSDDMKLRNMSVAQQYGNKKPA